MSIFYERLKKANEEIDRLRAENERLNQGWKDANEQALKANIATKQLRAEKAELVKIMLLLVDQIRGAAKMKNPWGAGERAEQVQEAEEFKVELLVASKIVDVFRGDNVDPPIAIYILAKLLAGMIATALQKDNQKDIFELITDQMRSWLKL